MRERGKGREGEGEGVECEGKEGKVTKNSETLTLILSLTRWFELDESSF